MEEPIQPTEPVVPTTTTVPEAKPSRHLGLIFILVVLGLAIAALIYISVKPAPTADLNGSAAAGTDNQSLTNDLNSVNSSLNQGDQNLGSADTALNDQQPTITGN